MSPGLVTRRAELVALSALLAAAAFYGAAGLITGVLPITAAMADRLPFGSPVFGGIALALVVAVPMSVAAGLLWTRHPAARTVAAATGLTLVLWIAVELVIIREFSPLQVICVLAGAVLFVLARRAR